MDIKCCDTCISRAHPRTRKKFPRWWCTRTAKFVTIMEVCELWVSGKESVEIRRLDKIASKSKQLELF